MPSARIGKAALAAATDTDIITIPAGNIACVNASLCNCTNAPIAVRLAIHASGVPLAAADYLEYDTLVPANGVLERTGLSMTGGETLSARAATAGIAVRAHGYEETP